jgi:beta-lactamase class A
MPNALSLALAGLAALPAAAAAQEPLPAPPAHSTTAGQTPLEARADQVVALLNGSAAPEDIFTAGFRAAIADAQLASLSASLTAQFGRAVEVALLEPRAGTRAVLHINAWFAPLDGGAPVISINADKPLALGSAFKLYVLAALAEDVKAGRRSWSDIVALDQKSYPSGKLQDWPVGAPLTLHTLASLMISISDNTATDQLITVLGKERILAAMRDSGHGKPGLNDPFLTTRELFLLKASPDELIEVWRKGGVVTRRATAAMIAQTRVPLDKINAAFAQGPRAIDIEWFAAPADLARLFAHMRRTADPRAFAIMGINPAASPAVRAQWDYIGFKGGSEPGVINLTWLLRDGAGRDWVLTLGWNNPAAVVEDGKLEGLAQRILLLPR